MYAYIEAIRWSDTMISLHRDRVGYYIIVGDTKKPPISAVRPETAIRNLDCAYQWFWRTVKELEKQSTLALPIGGTPA